MTQLEKRIAWISAAFVLVLLSLSALAINLFHVGLPTCLSDIKPFQKGEVITHSPTHYEVHYVAQMWKFEPEDVTIPAGSTVDIYLSAADVTHGLIFAGYPVILSPIYTRCQTACVLNVEQLKRTLGDVASDPRQFRVLLFSFDSGDTSLSLAKYRRRENIPLSWSIGTASQADTDALLESIGFQYGKAGGEFVHPNLLIFLDSNQRIAKWIYGTAYSADDVDLALKIAARGNDGSGNILSGSTRCCFLPRHCFVSR